MYFKLRGENPFMSGNAVLRSCDSRSMTLAPQPCSACRTNTSRPICQYSCTSYAHGRIGPYGTEYLVFRQAGKQRAFGGQGRHLRQAVVPEVAHLELAFAEV